LAGGGRGARGGGGGGAAGRAGGRGAPAPAPPVAPPLTLGLDANPPDPLSCTNLKHWKVIEKRYCERCIGIFFRKMYRILEAPICLKMIKG
jgi:hypothetical protein